MEDYLRHILVETRERERERERERVEKAAGRQREREGVGERSRREKHTVRDCGSPLSLSPALEMQNETWREKGR